MVLSVLHNRISYFFGGAMSTIEPTTADLRAMSKEEVLDYLATWHQEKYGCPLPIYARQELKQYMRSYAPAFVAANFQKNPLFYCRLGREAYRQTCGDDVFTESLLTNVGSWHVKIFGSEMPPYFLDAIRAKLSRKKDVFTVADEVFSHPIDTFAKSAEEEPPYYSQLLFKFVYATTEQRQWFWDRYERQLYERYRGIISASQARVLADIARLLIQRHRYATPYDGPEAFLADIIDCMNTYDAPFWLAVTYAIDLEEYDLDDFKPLVAAAIQAKPHRRRSSN